RPRPRRLYEVTSAGTLGPSIKQLLVYCLLITRQLEMVADPAGAERRSAPPPPVAPNAPIGRMQLQPKQQPKAPSSADLVDERAPGLRTRDKRASSPTLTPVPKESIEAAIPE